MGIHVQISGKGCRFIEQLEEFTWHGFFSLVLFHGCTFSRCDIAIDDRDYLNMDRIKGYIQAHLVSSRFKTYSKTEKFKFKDNIREGDTLYIGSRDSDAFIRIYDQSYKSEDKLNLVRLEMVLKDGNAQKFIKSYLNPKNFKNLTFVINKVLNNYIRFIKKDSTRNKRCSNAEWWDDFLITAEKMSLGVGRSETTLDGTCSWIERSVASSLKLIVETKGEMYLKAMIEKALLDERKKQIKDEYLKAANE